MSYSQFHDGFWTDPEIRKLTSDEMLLLVWFITNPYRHYSGLYFFEFESIGKQTKLSEKTVLKGIDTLSVRYRFIQYNPEFSMVWVRKMFKWQTKTTLDGGNPEGKGQSISKQQLKGVANHFNTLHNCPLIKDFLEYYDTLLIPYTYTLSRNTEEETEEEIKTEEKDNPPTPLSGGKAPSPQNLAKLWNEKAPPELSRVNLPLQRKPKDMDKIKDALKRNPERAWWERVILRLFDSPHCRGMNDRGWKASFDFMVSHAEVILDGKYDGGGGPSNAPKGLPGLKKYAERRLGE
jgi:hypothetical protein